MRRSLAPSQQQLVQRGDLGSAGNALVKRMRPGEAAPGAAAAAAAVVNPPPLFGARPMTGRGDSGAKSASSGLVVTKSSQSVGSAALDRQSPGPAATYYAKEASTPMERIKSVGSVLPTPQCSKPLTHASSTREATPGMPLKGPPSSTPLEPKTIVPSRVDVQPSKLTQAEVVQLGKPTSVEKPAAETPSATQPPPTRAAETHSSPAVVEVEDSTLQPLNAAPAAGEANEEEPLGQVRLSAVFLKPTAAQRLRYEELRDSFDTTIVTRGTRQQIDMLREVCNAPAGQEDKGAKLQFLQSVFAIMKKHTSVVAVVLSTYQSLLDALAVLCMDLGLAVLDPASIEEAEEQDNGEQASSWRVLLARSAKSCRSLDLSRATHVIVSDSDSNAVDLEALQLFGDADLPQPLAVWRLVVVGSVEESPFLAKAAPNRISTRLLVSRSCVVHEESTSRRKTEAYFEDVWDHLHSLKWTSKPGPGLEPWWYFAPGANKKNGVRRETFFKSKKEILEFVERTKLCIPATPTNMLSWEARTSADGVRDELLRVVFSKSGASCVMEMSY